MFKFKFLPICRAHSMAVPHPAAFPSAKYTVSPPIFHPTSGYRPGKKKRTCFDAIKIFIYRLFMEPSRTMISIACVASVSVKDRAFVKLIENAVAFLFTLTLILKLLFNIYM